MYAKKIITFEPETFLKIMADNDEHVVENIDTPIGQELLKLLLAKSGLQLSSILGKSTLLEFIDYRCELFFEALGDGYQSEGFRSGPIGHTGVAEKARHAAFEGLQ